MPFSPEDLFNFVQNDKAMQERFVRHVNWLRNVVDCAARQKAKDNAEWHDDPEKDDHANHHAHATEQFPPDVRREAVRDLVLYMLDNKVGVRS